MKTPLIIYYLAFISLLGVAAMNIVGRLRQMPGVQADTPLATLFGIAFWSWLLWKMWKRPRQWGLGVGIFLFLMIAFQSYLWWLGLNNPELAKLDIDRSVTNFILFYELPIFIAGAFCILLRFNPPNSPADSKASSVQ